MWKAAHATSRVQPVTNTGFYFETLEPLERSGNCTYHFRTLIYWRTVSCFIWVSPYTFTSSQKQLVFLMGTRSAYRQTGMMLYVMQINSNPFTYALCLGSVYPAPLCLPLLPPQPAMSYTRHCLTSLSPVFDLVHNAVWTSSQLQCIRDEAGGMNLESVSKCQLWLVLCIESMAAASHVTTNALPFSVHYGYKLFPVSSAVYAIFQYS